MSIDSTVPARAVERYDRIKALAGEAAWDAIRARSEVKRDGFVAVCAHCVRTFELVALPCDTHSTSEERTEREQRLEAASGGAA